MTSTTSDTKVQLVYRLRTPPIPTCGYLILIDRSLRSTKDLRRLIVPSSDEIEANKFTVERINLTCVGCETDLEIPHVGKGGKTEYPEGEDE